MCCPIKLSTIDIGKYITHFDNILLKSKYFIFKRSFFLKHLQKFVGKGHSLGHILIKIQVKNRIEYNTYLLIESIN